jgi:hypothetical protein
VELKGVPHLAKDVTHDQAFSSDKTDISSSCLSDFNGRHVSAKVVSESTAWNNHMGGKFNHLRCCSSSAQGHAAIKSEPWHWQLLSDVTA